MWRSWVDRINATNKESEQFTDGTSTPISPETLERRENEQNELRELLSKALDPRIGEKESSDVFLDEFLPKFCTTWETYKEDHVFTAIDDARSFMAKLTRSLLSGIRRVPEQKSKAESSQVLMDNLRSKSHMYNVIRTIRVIAYGPETLVDLMLQQRIPSVIIKLFRSFIDLPPDYYTSNNNNNNEEEQEEEDNMDDELVSFEQASFVVTDTLKRFAQNKAVVRRLIVEDTFFMMIRLISVKPVEWDNHATKEELIEPAYMIWKRRALDILKVVPMTIEVSQYLKSRRCLEMLLQIWTDSITNVKEIGSVELREDLIALDLITYQLESTLEADFHVLYDDFNQGKSWTILTSLLLTPSINDKVEEMKNELIEAVVKLCFIGKDQGSPSLSEGLPYQHPDFKFPKPDPDSSKNVSNIHAFQTLLETFTYPHNQRQPSSSANGTTNHGKQSPLSKTLKRKIFMEMKHIIQMSSVNYFTLERTNTVPVLIESMESYDIDIQNEIMDLLAYIIKDLNFVPLKELAVLSLHFQSSSSGNLVGLICRRLGGLLREFPKFRTVVREAGILNVISLMLTDMTESLNREQEVEKAEQEEKYIISKNISRGHI
ncbi:hypothetical protein BDC45DRAFT_305100 [Circinella umbellata]|nr:hypothetical protein BDC45DRAFT_305100 [Circinella umbellata]